MLKAIGPDCVLACRPVSLGGQLTPEESLAVERAIPARRLEFAAGRAAARVALSALGRNGVSIPMGTDRAPQWPSGIVGSISHGAGFAVAAVSRKEKVCAIGIDVEPNLPLPEDVLATVVGPADRCESGMERAVFCAKEATYKALFPLSGDIWDFGDLTIRLDPESERFSAILSRAAGPIPVGSVLGGSLITQDGLCIASLALPQTE
jgi:4'-phosphopantetheinyl transferase EntD